MCRTPNLRCSIEMPKKPFSKRCLSREQGTKQRTIYRRIVRYSYRVENWLLALPFPQTLPVYSHIGSGTRSFCLGFLTLLNAPFHKSFLLWFGKPRKIVPGEGESLESRLAKLGLHCKIFFGWEINSVYSRDSRYDSRTGTLLLMNIQLNLHIQHLAFQQILYDMRTSVSSQHLYQQLSQSKEGLLNQLRKPPSNSSTSRAGSAVRNLMSTLNLDRDLAVNTRSTRKIWSWGTKKS